MTAVKGNSLCSCECVFVCGREEGLLTCYKTPVMVFHYTNLVFLSPQVTYVTLFSVIFVLITHDCDSGGKAGRPPTGGSWFNPGCHHVLGAGQ